MINDKANEVIKGLFESLLNRCQIGFETSTRGVYCWVYYMPCKCLKINLKRGGSNIDSPDWIKNKKTTINPINDDHKCFQYAETVA